MFCNTPVKPVAFGVFCVKALKPALARSPNGRFCASCDAVFRIICNGPTAAPGWPVNATRQVLVATSVNCALSPARLTRPA